ncbi:MAG: site-specific integrase, partial [Oscillospiraceae bacterium]|nr:site-specific integrase [Oscillospiraceae bacterium]
AATAKLRAQQTGPSQLTLGDAIDEYIEAQRPVLSPSTVGGYQRIRAHHFPALMPIKLSKIDRKMLQGAVSQEAKKYAPKTVKNAFGLVTKVLRWNDVPVPDVQLPAPQRKPKQYMQVGELPRFIEALQGDSREVPILLAVWCGMRRSEIMGLCWDAVDLDRGLLTVMRSLVQDGENNWVLKESPKTSACYRTIPLPEYIVERFKLIPSGSGAERVWTSRVGSLTDHVHSVCKRAGVTDTSLHGLRHTFGAAMRYMGVDDGTAMKLGGWSSAETYKRTYSYVFRDAEDAAMAKMSSLLTGGNS